MIYIIRFLCLIVAFSPAIALFAWGDTVTGSYIIDLTKQVQTGCGLIFTVVSVWITVLYADRLRDIMTCTDSLELSGKIKLFGAIAWPMGVTLGVYLLTYVMLYLAPILSGMQIDHFKHLAKKTAFASTYVLFMITVACLFACTFPVFENYIQFVSKQKKLSTVRSFFKNKS